MSHVWIRERALEIGFDAVGFTTVEPLEGAGRALELWLARGAHGSMTYLESPAIRHRPDALLEGARSAIVTLTRYQAGPGSPRPLAAYATRDDYHWVLKKRLASLGEEIEQRTGARSRPVVDTAPLLEKALAERAGVGWIGKATNLVNERLGCHTLVGTLLTTLQIPPDEPAKNRCGTCRRCLDACPTNAFDAPYHLDARRCLSYWTIEHRGPIPERIRAAQGIRLFGCDDCLDACPFGHQTRETESPALPTRNDLTSADPKPLFEQGRDRFKKTYGTTAIPRATKKGFLRNATVALANGGGEGALDALKGLACHPDAAVREHAQWSLERLAAESAGQSPRNCAGTTAGAPENPVSGADGLPP